MTRSMRAALLGGLLLLAPRLASAADVTVTIDNFTFTPVQIEVAPGTRVVWTNQDDIPHTVTDATQPDSLRSRPLDTADTYARTFDQPGTYRYFCSLHPHMQGVVVVR